MKKKSLLIVFCYFLIFWSSSGCRSERIIREDPLGNASDVSEVLTGYFIADKNCLVSQGLGNFSSLVGRHWNGNQIEVKPFSGSGFNSSRSLAGGIIAETLINLHQFTACKSTSPGSNDRSSSVGGCEGEPEVISKPVYFPICQDSYLYPRQSYEAVAISSAISISEANQFYLSLESAKLPQISLIVLPVLEKRIGLENGAEDRRFQMDNLAFVDSFLEKPAFVIYPTSASRQPGENAQSLNLWESSWTLGHEFGHLVLASISGVKKSSLLLDSSHKKALDASADATEHLDSENPFKNDSEELFMQRQIHPRLKGFGRTALQFWHLLEPSDNFAKINESRDGNNYQEFFPNYLSFRDFKKFLERNIFNDFFTKKKEKLNFNTHQSISMHSTPVRPEDHSLVDDVFGQVSRQVLNRKQSGVDSLAKSSLSQVSRIVSNQDVWSAVNEGFADLFATAMSDGSSLTSGVPCIAQSRNPDYYLFQTGEPKVLNESLLNGFHSSEFSMPSSNCASPNAQSPHTVGAIIAYGLRMLSVARGDSSIALGKSLILWARKMGDYSRKNARIELRELILEGVKSFGAEAGTITHLNRAQCGYLMQVFPDFAKVWLSGGQVVCHN